MVTIIGRIAIGMLSWEILQRCYDFGLSALLTRVPSIVCDEKPKASRRTLLDEGGWYAVAFTHACLVGARGCLHLWNLRYAPIAQKLTLPADASEDLYAAYAIRTTNAIFLSWLLYDLRQLLARRHKTGGLDVPMLVHHLIFISASLICGSHNALPFAFSWLIVGECSSVPLNIRWFLLHAGRGDGAGFAAAQIAFAGLFFVVRILVGGAGLAHLLYYRADAYGVMGPTNGWLVRLVLLILSGGFGLNVMWLRKIVAMAMRNGASKKAA